MSGAPRRSINLRISLGFAAFALSLACSSSSSPEGAAGAAGAAPSDGGSATGGTGQGGSTTGGTNQGGSTTGGANQGGSSGSIAGGGGDNDCEHSECLVANTCLDHCDGKVIYTGCCACVPPAVNKNACAN